MTERIVVGLGVALVLLVVAASSSAGVTDRSLSPPCTIDPDTGQCWIDTDGDGVQDSADNCRTTANPDQADNDDDGIGTSATRRRTETEAAVAAARPRPTSTPNSSVGAGTALPEENVTTSGSGGQAAGLSIRCKTQRYVQAFTQLGLYDVLKVETRFRVCYVPGKRIYSFKREDPLLNPNPQADAIFTRLPWEWNGVDQTYPQVAVYSDRVEMKMQGSARVCIFSYGCGPTRHPWVRIVFRPNNTIMVTSGVA